MPTGCQTSGQLALPFRSLMTGFFTRWRYSCWRYSLLIAVEPTVEQARLLQRFHLRLETVSMKSHVI